ncbi:hypothetical protein Pint_04745 [Pistacia integerrima]|uniref:Uncharacterized protein n=1 Tax=Pistacia integerrima TaxID=434235 RepID=A0ACC0Z476_9ROSI|nr:hypothetical protein Pint_04745 [Pistacia integerrima]
MVAFVIRDLTHIVFAVPHLGTSSISWWFLTLELSQFPGSSSPWNFLDFLAVPHVGTFSTPWPILRQTYTMEVVASVLGTVVAETGRILCCFVCSDIYNCFSSHLNASALKEEINMLTDIRKKVSLPTKVASLAVVGVEQEGGRVAGGGRMTHKSGQFTCLDMNMKTYVDIKMDILNGDEAWQLICQSAGNVASLGHIKPFAEAICTVYCDLPLAIISVGMSMRGKTKVELWRNALSELQKSGSFIRGIENKVFKPLKLKASSILLQGNYSLEIIPEVIATTLLGLFFLNCSRGKKKSGDASMKIHKNERSKRSENLTHPAEVAGSTDVIIVGAGVAGSALAYTLAKDGRRVHVIERDLTEPDRIVGELLQPGGYLKLIELGLEDCVNTIDAQQVFGYALYKDGKSNKVSYPLENFNSDVAGRSFHNGRFIQRMREKAASQSNVRLEQGTVTSLIEEKGIIKGVTYKTKTGQELTTYAPLTVVCDGCCSNLRRSLSKPKVEIPSCFVGLILENCELPYKNHGHVILADPSPILFYPISSTEIRCLVDVPGQRVPSISNGEMTNYLKTVVAPQIPHELHSAFMAAIDKGNIRTMTNRSMPAAPSPTPGALLLGDSFNMRHPLTGGGMTVALSDIVVLRDLLRRLGDLNDAHSLCKYLESFYTLRKPVASTINTLAGALYKVFCASPDPSRNELRQACFDYLSLGGGFTNGPIAILSGLNPRPLSLVSHFFAVAIYGVGRLLLPFPSPKRMLIGARLILDASSIIFPIMKAEGVKEMLFPASIPTHYAVQDLCLS